MFIEAGRLAETLAANSTLVRTMLFVNMKNMDSQTIAFFEGSREITKQVKTNVY